MTGEKKGAAPVLVIGVGPRSEPADEDGEDLAEAILSAVKRGDAKALSRALSAHACHTMARMGAEGMGGMMGGKGGGAHGGHGG